MNAKEEGVKPKFPGLRVRAAEGSSQAGASQPRKALRMMNTQSNKGGAGNVATDTRPT